MMELLMVSNENDVPDLWTAQIGCNATVALYPAPRYVVSDGGFNQGLLLTGECWRGKSENVFAEEDPLKKYALF